MWQDNYYLYHHGILGQRWGRKNGPPYPLGSSDHSASEKRAGWRKSLDKPEKSSHTKNSNVSKEFDNSERDGFHLTDKQKKALKIGAAAVAASLTAYGTYKLAQSGKLNDLAAIGKAKVDAMLGKKAGSAGDDSIISDKIKKLSSETGFKANSKLRSIEEACRSANPNYNPNNPAYKNNCGKAVVADILNRMGFDVQAKGLSISENGQRGLTWFDVLRPFKGSGVEEHVISKMDIKSVESCKNSVSKRILSYCNGNDAMGVFRAERINGAAHYMKWEVQGGKVSYQNSQVGVSNCDTWFTDMVDKKVKRFIEFARVDNLEIDSEVLKELVENRML